MKQQVFMTCLMCISTCVMHGAQLFLPHKCTLYSAAIIAAPVVIPALYYMYDDSKTYEGTLNHIRFRSFNNWSHFQIGFATGILAPMCIAVARESYQEMYAMLTSNRAVCAGFISGLSCYATIPLAAKIIVHHRGGA